MGNRQCPSCRGPTSNRGRPREDGRPPICPECREHTCPACLGPLKDPRKNGQTEVLCYTCYRCTKLKNNIKGRAVDRGYEYEVLTVQYYRDLPRPTHCPILGIPMEWGYVGKRGNPGLPEIDKLDPKLGYVRGNMRWASARGNRLKDNATIAELRLVLADAERLQRERQHERGHGATPQAGEKGAGFD